MRMHSVNIVHVLVGFVCLRLDYRISSIRRHGYYFFLLLVSVWLLFEGGYYARAVLICLENSSTSMTAKQDMYEQYTQ